MRARKGTGGAASPHPGAARRLALRVRSAVALWAVMIASATVAVRPQATEQQPPLRFEVASVKPSGTEPGGTPPGGGRVIARGATVEGLMLRAYGVRPFQIEGGPAWIRSEAFDISAKAPSEAVTEAEMYEMVKDLLADRFGLRVRRETRDQAVYRLRLVAGDGRLGPGLRRTSLECQQWIDAKVRGTTSAPPRGGATDPSQPRCGVSGTSPIAANAAVRLTMGGVPMAQLGERLVNALAAPVIDETGLTGLYDIALEYERPKQSAPQGSVSFEVGTAMHPPPIEAALPQQLGLRLERGTGPVNVLVVEAVKRPEPD